MKTGSSPVFLRPLHQFFNNIGSMPNEYGYS